MNIQNRPAAKQIQPIEFSGRLEAIRAPTRGKARKGKKSTRSPSALAVAAPLEGSVAGAAYKDNVVSAPPPMNMATARQASDQANQEAARELIGPIFSLRPHRL